ncbi:MAG TPA: MFS transporter [Jatrophihabitans sp.]|nr:MFS transporter [Jatrophihabitans sp.]
MTQLAAPARTRIPRVAAFWFVAATTGALLAASSAPSPLYPVYQGEFGFGPTTLTAIFAVYVLALLASLLTVGRLSDVIGRRPVLVVSLLVEAASMALFLAADGAGWLFAARTVQGLATGAAIGGLGAYLLDLQPPTGSRLGSLVNSVAPTAGLGVGAAGTGLLVQYGPHPTRLVFAILTVAFVLLALGLLALPETAERVPGVLASLRPQVAVPPRARQAFGAAVPTMVATWGLGGLMLSVGGSLLGAVLGQANHAVVGALLGLFCASGSVAALATRDYEPARMTAVGLRSLLLGTALFLLSLATTSAAVFAAAAIAAGAGFGSAFLGALRSVTQLAEPHQRAALLSAVYVASYLGFSIPALLAGLIIPHAGLRDTCLGYGTFVALVAAGALALEALLARRPQPVG